MTPSPARRLAGAALGFGFVRPAPGTWGSLGGVLAYLAVFGVGDARFEASIALPALLVASALIFAVGIWLGDRAEVDWGRKDPGGFVLDEVVGQWLALAPLVGRPFDLVAVAVAFGAFRLFDILKPPPVRWLEDRPGGLGIMADDVAAGVLAAGVVLLVTS